MIESVTVVKELDHRKFSYLGSESSTREKAIFHRTDRYVSYDREFKAGVDLFQLGDKADALYRLTEGWVALYKLQEDGRRQILQFALPGSVLAFVPMRGAVVNYSAQALTDVIVDVIPHTSLQDFWKHDPELGFLLVSQISRDRSLAYDHISSVGRGSARERVAHLLLELFLRSRLRLPSQCSEEMHLPITQEDIGDAAGLTAIHVNRVLRDFRCEGIAEFRYRRLRIFNPGKLVDVAGIEPHVISWWVDQNCAENRSLGPVSSLANQQ